MVEVYGLGLILLVTFYCILCLKNEGLLFLFNYARLGFLIWTFALGLYDLKLSKLYHPDGVINVIGTVIIFNFIFLMKILPNESHRLVDICRKIELPRKGFFFALYFTLGLGIVAFLKNYNEGLLRFYVSNKGMRADISFSYFFHALVVVSICFYILFREEKKKRKKTIYLIISIISLFIEYTNLARGPLLFWGIGIIFYEILKYVIRRSYKVSIKQMIVFLLGLVLLIWGFGAIGDARTEILFGQSATRHYQMVKNLPSGFTWIYIYITSPLENLRYSLENDVITNYAFFNKLLYPIIKFFANIFGQGNQYANYVKSFNSITPYLWRKVGLNMSTFVSAAYLDANIIGIFVYVVLYDFVGFFIHKIIKSKKITSISKIIIVPLLLEISLWSIFTDSILGVSSIWSDVIFVLLWNFGNRLVLREYKQRYVEECVDGKIVN